MAGHDTQVYSGSGLVWSSLTCPACLKKLQWNVGLDVRAHYQQQRALFERAGFKESVIWADRRLAQLEAR